MKTATHYPNEKAIPCHSRKVPTYPNAADRHHQFSRLLDMVLTTAASVALVTALLFLLTVL